MRSLNPAPLFSTEARRALLLACLVALVFAVLGTVRAFAPASLLGDSPFDLDLALRTVALGWFEPRHTVPVTIVDIDEETFAGWGAPAVTPRGELEKLLRTVTAAGPLAVVLDIDLSWGGAEPVDDGQQRLVEFLVHHPGPAPIVLPKRLVPSADAARQPATSPFDGSVASNPHVAWAHASFETDAGGTVRHWLPWVGVCGATGPDWLPAVATAVVERLPPPPASEDCASMVDPPARRLLVGPRFTGGARAPPGRDARSVSAAMLLDPELARDDSRLFGGRVVLIGATHASAGDLWLTPAGVRPGVEMLANTVRFAPLQPKVGPASEFAYRAQALALFALFAAAGWWLRGLVAVLVSIVATLLIVSVAVGGFDDFGIFDALEAAILLTIAYQALRAVADFSADWRDLRREHPDGFRGTLSTVRDVCIRQD